MNGPSTPEAAATVDPGELQQSPPPGPFPRPTLVLAYSSIPSRCCICNSTIPAHRYVLAGTLSEDVVDADSPVFGPCCALDGDPASCALVMALNGLLLAARDLPSDELMGFLADAVEAVMKVADRLQVEAASAALL